MDHVNSGEEKAIACGLPMGFAFGDPHYVMHNGSIATCNNLGDHVRQKHVNVVVMHFCECAEMLGGLA